ncbi:MAG: hypothetical protein ACE5FD_10395, partial [Anaerolineae bacterium]
MKSKYQGLVAKKAGIPAPFLIKSLAWMAQKSLFFHLLLMTIVLLLSAWLVFEPLVFANSDVGLRFIQIRSLVEQGWNTLAIPYPTEIDPGFNFSPYYYAYSLLDGRLYFNISPFFPLASSFFYR